MDAISIISKHERIALQFSGGRDSIACLYLMRPHWDRMTVYWCDTGAAFPETVEIAEKVRAMVPNFVRVKGRQPQVISEFGIPSDLVPSSATPLGRFVGGDGVLIQDRYSCCIRSYIAPMLERMVEDRITLIIRGQKNSDRLKSRVQSGDVMDGIEYYFPIEDWSPKQVMTYLREQNAPIPRFYEMLNGAPDCMTCSAWWEEGSSAYLKRYHYTQYQENQRRLDVIRQAVSEHIAAFNREIEP